MFGCFKIEKIRADDNETDLKEGGVTEIKTTVLYSRATLSLCNLLTRPTSDVDSIDRYF